MRVRTSRPSNFSLRLRIPAWSSQPGAIVRVNGKNFHAPIRTGFAALQRRWKDGDHIELELALPVRVEAIDSSHPDTVALLRGPQVLFAITDHPPTVTRQQLLSPVQLPQQAAWRVDTAAGPLLFRPFTAIEDEHYCTYLNVG